MPEHKIHIYSQIHDIVFFGKGGYSWDSVYDFPIWLRNFTYSKLEKHYAPQVNNDSAVNVPVDAPTPPVNTPKPDYKVKASK